MQFRPEVKVLLLELEYYQTPIEHYRALFSILAFLLHINIRQNNQPS